MSDEEWLKKMAMFRLEGEYVRKHDAYSLIPDGLSYRIDLFLCCSREQEEDEAAGGITPSAAGEITVK